MATLRARIARDGPITLAEWMAACNAAYYAAGPGPGRDFATAPEITQAFGELLGLWAAELWHRAGAPAGVRLVELGPGRGTLMADALRAAAKFGFEPAAVELVETSPALRAEQAARVLAARWHRMLADVPGGSPVILLANELLDALPVRQFVRQDGRWHERCITTDGGAFAPTAGPPVDIPDLPPELAGAPDGAILERGEAAAALVAQLAQRLVRDGGAALLIDYGHAGPALGETLQAVRAGERADPLAAPGQADLSAHVDFAALAAVAQAAGCAVHGPLPQGVLLERLGIRQRTDVLAAANPAAAARLKAAAVRLTAPEQMGALFKALAITAPGWPVPAGFA
ncbi:MAG: class I SAM-dependent methyltransferase [Sphingomonadaceae bacterium]